MRCVNCIFSCAFFATLYFLVTSFPASPTLQSKCNTYCLIDLLSTAENSNPSCNKTCIANQCQLGCAFLSKALISSCKDVCSEIEITGKEPYYCQFGCVRTINDTIEEKKKLVGVPQPPHIIPDTLTDNSVKLAWNTGNIRNVSFLVQWKYESLPGEWNYYQPNKPIASNKVVIENLRPFTKYRFRVAYIISHHTSPIFSKPSLVVQTEAKGLPSTAPKIKKLAAVSSSSVAIEWDPPDFPNGPILAYTLYLTNSAIRHTVVKEIKLPKTTGNFRNSTWTSYLFTDLKPATLYTISITCLNPFGEGPRALGDVVTDNETSAEAAITETMHLIIASHKVVYMQNQDISEMADIVYQLSNHNSTANITDVALHIKKKLLYVSETSGAVRRLVLNNTEDFDVKTILEPDNNSTHFFQSMSLDWIDDILYLVDGHTVFRCGLLGENLQKVVEGTSGFITNIHVDPLNGQLFWASTNSSDDGIYRISLSSLTDKPISFKEAQLIYNETQAQVFTLDFEDHRLYIPTTAGGRHTILSLSTDASNVTDIRGDNVDVSQLKNVTSIVHFNGSFYWTTWEEVYLEEFFHGTQKYYHNALIFEDIAFVAVKVLHSSCQPYSVINPSTEPVLVTPTLVPEEDGAPLSPLIIKIIEVNGRQHIIWEAIEKNLSKILGYELWQKCYQDHHWTMVYRGSENQWIPSETQVCLFKVNAYNEHGRSNFSEYLHYDGTAKMKPIDLTSQNSITYVVALVIPLALAVIACFFLCSATARKFESEKKMLHAEIVQLPELPGHPHENNALYLPGDVNFDEELPSVPQLIRHQINFTKFLGSGAFAEVYEGLAHDFCGEPAVKVAIKTLRSGATMDQKSDFLKEAKLMENFKHKHILKLLGICLDSNPFLIFELMEGGDLLSYLRLNRPDGDKSSPLTLGDLLSISTDVAKGCKYLEEMHYVHRDLAARNCLVSSYNRAERVVKIGDFGLARDVYKNDYYRKEGEGLLPVRWMAPESLTDGVFTTQSDIWSFAVLLWEVFTLGQQPYQARANVEVWNYVRNGGRLVVPHNCPHELRTLLNRCWSFDSRSRPDFSFCLKTLQNTKEKLSASELSLTSVHNQNYSVYNYTNTTGWSHRNFSSETVAIDDLENASVKSETSDYLKPFNSVENLNQDEDGYKFPYLHLLKQGDKIPEEILDAFITIETKIN